MRWMIVAAMVLLALLASAVSTHADSPSSAATEIRTVPHTWTIKLIPKRLEREFEAQASLPVEARRGAGEHGLKMLAQLAAAVAVWLAPGVRRRRGAAVAISVKISAFDAFRFRKFSTCLQLLPTKLPSLGEPICSLP